MRIGPSHFPNLPGQAVEDALWLASDPFPRVRGDLPEDIAYRTIAVLRTVVARRAAGAGTGVASETVGPFTRTYTAQSGGGGLTRGEAEALRRISEALECAPGRRMARTIPMYGDNKGCPVC